MDFFRHRRLARRRSAWLVLLYIAALLATSASVSLVLGTLLAWAYGFAGRPAAYYLPFALGTAALVVSLSLHRIKRLRRGGGEVAAELGGRRLTRREADFLERRLLNLCEETAAAAMLPAPAVYLIDGNTAINAFAAGTERGNAAIGVTRGALEQLTRDQMQALLAHEFSHIRHGDMRLNQYLSGWLYGLQSIAGSGRYLLEGQDGDADYRRSKNVDNHPFDGLLEIVLPLLPTSLIGALLLALGAVGSLCARWIQAAVLRQREFLADAEAVRLTRQKEPMLELLRLIGSQSLPHKAPPHTDAYAHMMFCRLHDGAGSLKARLAATHPPLIERIRRIDPAYARSLPDDWQQQPGHAGDGIFFADSPAALAQRYAAERENREQEYRSRYHAMQARIRRHRPDAAAEAALTPLWQNAADDEEYASAALLALFGCFRQPENGGNGENSAIAANVWRLLPAMAAQCPPPAPAVLETLLPAFLMQEEAARDAVLAACRAAVETAGEKQPENLSAPENRQNPPAGQPATEGSSRGKNAAPIAPRLLLWKLLAAYLAPAPEFGRRSEYQDTELLAPQTLDDAALEAALAAAAPLNESARNNLLRPQAARLSAANPLLWRLLCVRLNCAAWNVGGSA